MKRAYIGKGTTDKEVIFEKVRGAFLQMQPPVELTRQKFNAAYEISSKPSEHFEESDETVEADDESEALGGDHSSKSGETEENRLAKNQKVSPKELDTFITGLLKGTSEEMTWNRLTKLTKVYKKEAGAALLEAVFKKIDQMQKDGLPEKLMLPHLEGQFGTNFKALVGSLRPHVNDKGPWSRCGKLVF